MRVKSNMKAGALTANHNQTTKGLRVKSNLKAGGSFNHNQTVKGLRIKSSVKAGGLVTNHNQTLA